jgi:hypothetical protein
LPGIEAEAGDVPDSAHALSVVLGSVRLRCVFDHYEIPPGGDLHDRVHIGRLAIEMNWHDRAGPRRDPGLDLADIHRAGVGIDIDENRGGTRVSDRRHGRDEGHGYCYHLIAGTDSRG